MCNIAGYVGKRDAAPIVTEMLRRQEGLDAGFYTGVVTYGNDHFHMCKTVGDMRTLEEKMQGVSLDGNVGLAHSRTPGGGDDHWSHPFWGVKEGKNPRLAYVSNGTFGVFWDQIATITPIADELMAQGYTLETATNDFQWRLNLSSGESVHITEVFTKQICRNMDEGMDELSALKAAFRVNGGEWVGLMLSEDHPDRVYFMRWNMPMFVAFSDHGAYMASCPIAFPEDAGEPVLLPAGSVGWISAEGYYAEPFSVEGRHLAPLDAEVRTKAYGAILDGLKKGEMTFPQMRECLIPLFEKGLCAPGNALAYDILSGLYKAGKVTMHVRELKGMKEGLLAPQCSFSLTI